MVQRTLRTPRELCASLGLVMVRGRGKGLCNHRSTWSVALPLCLTWTRPERSHLDSLDPGSNHSAVTID